MLKDIDFKSGKIEYDQFNITVYDPVTATSTKIARDEATDYFAQFGNIFVTAVYTDR